MHDQHRALAAGALASLISCAMAYRCEVNYMFWINKVGLILLSIGSAIFIDVSKDRVDGEWLAISFAQLILAVVLRFPSYAGTGSLGLFLYINVYLANAFRGNLVLPVALLIQPIALAVLAAKLQWVVSKWPRFTAVLRKWSPTKRTSLAFAFCYREQNQGSE